MREAQESPLLTDHGVRVAVGCPVVTADGERLGTIKEIRGAYFKVDAPMQPDYWLRLTEIAEPGDGTDRACLSEGCVTLAFPKAELKEYRDFLPPDRGDAPLPARDESGPALHQAGESAPAASVIRAVPRSESPANDATQPTGTAGAAPTGSVAAPSLFAGEEAARLWSRWAVIEAQVANDPRAAVTRADALVAEVLTGLVHVFAEEQGVLERRRQQGVAVSNADLHALQQRYHTFFARLL